MNYSKKIITLSLLFLTHINTSLLCAQELQEETVKKQIATLMNEIQAIQEHPYFTNRDFAMAAVSAVIGSVIGHLGTCAIANLLEQKTTVKPRYFTPSEWTFPLPLTTVGGAVYGGYLYLYSSNLKFLAEHLNQPLLVTVVGGKSNQLNQRLDEFYVSQRFPKAVAFKELTKLRESISSLIEALSKLTEKSAKAEARRIVPTLLTFSEATKDAMLLLKSDPRWFEECNASTLAMTQANIEGHQNAQFTATAIQLAHK